MPKHGGCFLCGSMSDEFLRSTPVAIKDAHSIALCSACRSLPNDEIKKRIGKIEAAMVAARQGAV